MNTWCEVSASWWWCFADKSQCPSAGPLACEHFCKPTLGSYRCFCARGYTLHSDGRRCSPHGTRLSLHHCTDPLFSSLLPVINLLLCVTNSSEPVREDRGVQLLSWWTLLMGGEHRTVLQITDQFMHDTQFMRCNLRKHLQIEKAPAN